MSPCRKSAPSAQPRAARRPCVNPRRPCVGPRRPCVNPRRPCVGPRWRFVWRKGMSVSNGARAWAKGMCGHTGARAYTCEDAYAVCARRRDAGERRSARSARTARCRARYAGAAFGPACCTAPLCTHTQRSPHARTSPVAQSAQVRALEEQLAAMRSKDTVEEVSRLRWARRVVTCSPRDYGRQCLMHRPQHTCDHGQ